MADPPERNISTVMPVASSNSLAIFCACSIGVEVYQTTLPSFFAAARCTSDARSAAGPSATANPQIVAGTSMREKGLIVTSSARTCSPAIDGHGLRKEAPENVVDHQVVLLLKRCVRDAGHHHELLVGIGQALEEADEILE